MALFDREQQKIVLRIVYDGAERAGKTTNVAQLHSFFTSRRRSEIFTPEVADGRTLYFDWMQLEGGLISGYSIRCQIITVPGQSSLSRRRWQLLKTADVVVFVCDSTLKGIEQAKPMFSLVRDYLNSLKRGVVPLVLQANKQDIEGALEPAAVALALEFEPGGMLAGARAMAGAGVRETVILAMRAAANNAQRIVLESGVESLAGIEETGEALYRSMLANEAKAAGEPIVEPAVRADAMDKEIATKRSVAEREARESVEKVVAERQRREAAQRAEVELSARRAEAELSARRAEAERAAHEILRKREAEQAAREAALQAETDRLLLEAIKRAEEKQAALEAARRAEEEAERRVEAERHAEVEAATRRAEAEAARRVEAEAARRAEVEEAARRAEVARRVEVEAATRRAEAEEVARRAEVEAATRRAEVATAAKRAQAEEAAARRAQAEEANRRAQTEGAVREATKQAEVRETEPTTREPVRKVESDRSIRELSDKSEAERVVRDAIRRRAENAERLARETAEKAERERRTLESSPGIPLARSSPDPAGSDQVEREAAKLSDAARPRLEAAERHVVERTEAIRVVMQAAENAERLAREGSVKGGAEYQRKVEAIEKAEAERVARESAEKAEAERVTREAVERAEAERVARESAEKAEAERVTREAVERAEAERVARESAEKAEAERVTREAIERAEAERVAREAAQKVEAERMAYEVAERAEAERLAYEAAERAEAERLTREAAEKAQAERAAHEAAERVETERLTHEAAEKAEAERAAREAAEKAEAERAAREVAEKAEAERAAREVAEKAEAERVTREAIKTAEAKRVAHEAAEKVEASPTAQEVADRTKVERLAHEPFRKAEAERATREVAQDIEAERMAREALQKAEADRLSREAAEKERAEQLALAAAKLNAERLERESAQRAEVERLALVLAAAEQQASEVIPTASAETPEVAAGEAAGALPEVILSAIGVEPPLPRHDVGIGFVWPAATGRDILRQVNESGPSVRRDDLVAQQCKYNGLVTSDAIVYQTGGWCLRTSLRRRFNDPDEARAALLRLARKKMQLGRLLADTAALSAQPEANGNVWLWSAIPMLPTLQSQLEEASKAGDEEKIGKLLVSFAEGAAEGLILAAHQRIAIELHPSYFVRSNRDLYYVGDDIAQGTRIPNIGDAILRRCEEYSMFRGAVTSYLTMFSTYVQRSLNGRMMAEMSLNESFLAEATRSAPASAAYAVLSRVIDIPA